MTSLQVTIPAWTHHYPECVLASRRDIVCIDLTNTQAALLRARKRKPWETAMRSRRAIKLFVRSTVLDELQKDAQDLT